MAIIFRAALVASATGLLAACGTSGSGDATPTLRGTNVTRIHLEAEIARGEVAVEPRFATQAVGGVYQPGYATAVVGELRTLGFTPSATPATSEFVATVDVATGTMATLKARTPATGMAPAATAADPNAVASQLAVQLKRRSDGSIVWEGQAQTAARAGAAPTVSTVQRLARALFRDFPGESGRTINVR